MTENKDEINPQLVNQITEDFNRVYKNLYYASKQIIKHDSAGIKMSNESLVNYYGDLLK